MSAKEVAENKSVPGKVEPRADGVKTKDQVTIHVTADQAKAAQGTVDSVSKNPGNYQVAGNSCVDFGERVMSSAGAKAPHDTLPSKLIGDIRNQQYHDNSTQTPK